MPAVTVGSGNCPAATAISRGPRQPRPAPRAERASVLRQVQRLLEAQRCFSARAPNAAAHKTQGHGDRETRAWRAPRPARRAGSACPDVGVERTFKHDVSRERTIRSAYASRELARHARAYRGADDPMRSSAQRRLDDQMRKHSAGCVRAREATAGYRPMRRLRHRWERLMDRRRDDVEAVSAIRGHARSLHLVDLLAVVAVLGAKLREFLSKWPAIDRSPSCDRRPGWRSCPPRYPLAWPGHQEQSHERLGLPTAYDSAGARVCRDSQLREQHLPSSPGRPSA